MRTQGFRALIGCGAGVLISAYLFVLLELSGEQWMWLAGTVAVFALAFGVLVQGFLLRVDRTIMELIDAEAAGDPRREQIRAGFAAAMRYPIYGLTYTVSTWASAGLVIPVVAPAALPRPSAGLDGRDPRGLADRRHRRLGLHVLRGQADGRAAPGPLGHADPRPGGAPGAGASAVRSRRSSAWR